MRIRSLKPDFFIDEDIAELKPLMRLFYQGLWCAADKSGRLEDRPIKLKAQLMPYDDFKVEEALQVLAKGKNNSPRAFVYRYEVDGEKYIQITSWEKHQKPHHTEKDSIIPPYNPLLKGKIPTMDKIHGKTKSKSTELENVPLTVKPVAPLKIVKDTDFKEKWNKSLYPKVKVLTEQRKIKLKSRLLEKDFVSNINKILRIIKETPFLQGDNDNGWQADFDWLIKNDTNYIKVLEGKYKKGNKSLSQLQAVADFANEEKE